MARCQRKSIEEKIQQNQKLIDSLDELHMKKELEALISEQKAKRGRNFYDFIKTSNLDINEATKILQQYIAEKYEFTA